ncbi:methyltransferase [Sulfuricystis thermophila]|uniref:methyltransferase n=1 Tax=Sulfuricystis thermophila TaxID=2496847 RepID=UPI0010355AB8|nr:methyltransferase [Sulfuricystis thermophila]
MRKEIAARFAAAATTYDAHSAAQRHAAQRLAERLAALHLPPRPRVLEIGCGTGHLTVLLALHLPGATILASDIAPAMVAACRERLGTNTRIDFAVMDGAQPAVAGPFDLVCGNLVAQWFDDPRAAFAALSALLAPGGVLLLSLPGSETFREWRLAHAAHGLRPGARPLPTSQACLAALPPGDNRIETEHWVDRPPQGIDFLRALRAIGADTPAAGHKPLGAGQLRRVLATLGPTPALTYEFLYLSHRQP